MSKRCGKRYLKDVANEKQRKATQSNTVGYNKVGIPILTNRQKRGCNFSKFNIVSYTLLTRTFYSARGIE